MRGCKMEQKSMRRIVKKKKIPVGKILIFLVMLGYLSRFGLTGPAFLYGSMERYMHIMLLIKYHKQFELKYVSLDDWGTFSDGGSMGTFYDEQGQEYKCYYLRGKFYDNYGITHQLGARAYEELDERLKEVVDVEDVTYTPWFSVNREHWWSSESYFKRALKKQFIEVEVEIKLTDTDREILCEQIWNIYQEMEKMDFPVIVKIYHGDCKIGYQSFPKMRDYTKEEIRRDIESGLEEDDNQRENGWEIV